MATFLHRNLATVWACTLSLVICLVTAGALGAAFPTLTGRVVDTAGMIDPATSSAIEQILKDHEAKSSDQVVVATIPSLDGEVLDDYANRLFRAWGLGQAQQNNGVLLLVARDDRKMRIEVGYGLEGTLTDLHSKLIIDNVIVPAFKAGNFGQGILAGVTEIVGVLSGNGEELEQRYRLFEEQGDPYWFVPAIFVGLWFALFLSIFVFVICAPIFGKKLGPGRYRWLGMDITVGGGSGRSGGSSGSSWSSSSSGGGYSGGGGSSGGGGASGSW